MNYVVDQSYILTVDKVTCILALLLCFIVKRTFIKNKHVFGVIFALLILVSSACLHNMWWYHLICGDSSISPILIYMAKNNYYICNIMILFLYVVYISYVSNYNEFKRTRIVYLNLLVTIICTILQLITPITGFGYHLSGSQFVGTMPDPFVISYLVSNVSIIYMLLKNRNNIVKELRVTLLIVNLIANLVVAYNMYLFRTAYLTMAALIPILTVLFVQHSNPYDAETGALDLESFNIFLKNNKGKEFYYMLLKLDKDEDELPHEVKLCIMNFYYNVFKTAHLFALPDTSYVLVIPKEELNTDKKVEKLVEGKFYKYYNEYRINYKIQLISFTDAFTNYYEFKFVTRKYMANQVVNTSLYLSKEDVLKVKESLLILDVLKDIDKEKNFNDKRVLVYCQPVKNVNTGIFDTAEALMRLNIDGLGVLTPDKFIWLAESENLIHSLSMIILNKTCKAIYDLREKGYLIKRISVNFSPMELRHKHCVSDVIDIVDTIGISHDSVAIEVTENVHDTDYDTMALRIKQLQAENICFYLDDFGTGYNNFDRMLSLNLDVLKFDRSLLLYALKNKDKSFILEHFAYMFKKLGYQVLFEGIETKEQEEFCKKSHADYLQGYLYSKPVPIEQLKDFLSLRQTENSSRQN